MRVRGSLPKLMKQGGEPNLIRKPDDSGARRVQVLGASVAGGLQRVIQIRHNVRRLNAVAKSTNSARTLAKPRRRNRRALSCSFSIAKA